MHELPGASFVTLAQVWFDYRQCRALKPNTVDNYRKVINKCLGDWLDMPVECITKEMVEQRHRELTSGTAAQANLTMRVLRALLTFAGYKYDHLNPLVLRNPVRRLSELRAWNRLPQRHRIILPHQMKPWFRAVFSLDRPEIRDFLLVLILTGLRRNEAAQLRWSDVDLQHRSITVRDTKNHNDHVLPMSTQLVEIFERRSQVKGEFVFPGRTAGTAMSRWNQSHRAVTDICGIDFMLHDLRRSFITVADQLDIPDRIIKRLANHKTNDITERYINRSLERLRGPMQAISDEIMRQADLTGFGGV